MQTMSHVWSTGRDMPVPVIRYSSLFNEFKTQRSTQLCDICGSLPPCHIPDKTSVWSSASYLALRKPAFLFRKCPHYRIAVEVEGNEASKHIPPYPAQNRWQYYYHCHFQSNYIPVMKYCALPTPTGISADWPALSSTKVETHQSVLFFAILGTFQNSTPLHFYFTPACFLALLANLKSFRKSKLLQNTLRDAAGHNQHSKSWLWF